ncbi:DUF11 domain-containing protein [Conexibacter woesei]|uniref:DUF11 domain-containing protein n=1 Tax=Conexibacter woesei TaxID=191495 RepID=UPI0003F54529|nr:DUF11 domain-containing protein [Conexibacter woesei]
MHTSILSRATTTLCAVLLLTLGALVYAAGAQADPGTVTGPNNLSLTVDDTTPAPGQVVNFDFSYTTTSLDTQIARLPGATFAFHMGTSLTTVDPPSHLDELALGTCGGQITSCSYDLARTFSEFEGAVPTTTTTGTTITGTASFTVSATATLGDVIGAFGGFADRSFFNHDTATDSRLDLTVTAPPAADLGVDLTATARGLLTSHINYDAAVTNNGPATASSATITTQLPSAATGISSSTCTYTSSTDQVSCPIGSIANGATTHATFRAYFGLLTIGLPLHTTATRTASSPTDNNATNDSDSADCDAITPLLIHC